MRTHIDGFVAPGYETVGEAFANTFDSQDAGGAALSIRADGNVVVDLWGGIADSRSGRPWTEGTPSVIFSATKGLVAVLAARLVQDGLLDYEARVSDYWPEFAQSGKEDIRVKDLLSHRSGLSAPREDLSESDILNWETVVGHLERQAPLWSPIEGYAYHALTYGWLIGEVIRRITGMSVGEYFHLLVAAPLGVDAWIGLPADEAERVAHLLVGESLAELVKSQAANRIAGEVDWLDRAMTLGGALPPELISATGGFNSAAIRAAEIPGAGGIATARALATIWSATVVSTNGVRLLNEKTLQLATRPQSEGAPIFSAPPPYSRWGMGLQLDSPARRYTSSRSFGHDGAGGQVGFADPDARLGFGYITNLMEALDDRATSIIDSLSRITTKALPS